MTTADEAIPDNLLQTLLATGAPDWYVRTVQHSTTSHRVSVRDRHSIHVVFWNESDVDKPSLLLLHGYRANARAWHAVAPYLTCQFRVLALDLMGMGESDHRTEYGNATQFANDVAAVVENRALGPVTLVGHSFGGACAIQLAVARPDLVRQLVIVDTTVLFPALDLAERVTRELKRREPYPTYKVIVERYRIVPTQPCPPWALAFMAHHSVRQAAEGWIWKFDATLPGVQLTYDTQSMLHRLSMRTDYICAALSNNGKAERVRLVERAIGQGRHAIVIPEAHHHMMLDQPLALVSALRALMA